MALNPPSANDLPATAGRASPSRRSISASVLVVAVLVAAGVSIGATAVYFQLHPSGPSVSGSSVTVVDDLGRAVTAPANAQRVVVLAPSIFDIVYRLGLRDRVVGVGCTPTISGGILNEYSPNQTGLWTLTNASCITDFPSLDTEKVANLSTTLVLASTITSQAAVDQLTNSYRIPVVLLAPSTLGGIVSDVRIVSALFPSSAPASTLVESELDGVLANASTIDTNLSNSNVSAPTVLLSYYFDTAGYYTYGAGSFGASLIDLAGGANVAASVGLVYAEMNASAVLNDNPAVVLYGTSWNDPYLVSHETPSVWTTAPYWNQLTGKLIPVDIVSVTEPGPGMILELPWLLHWLHPTVVPAPAAPWVA